MKYIKEYFEIVEDFRKIFRPAFWLGNYFNTIFLGPRVLQIFYNDQMPAYCAISLLFLITRETIYYSN